MKPAGLRHWLPVIAKYGVVVLFLLFCVALFIPNCTTRSKARTGSCVSNAKRLGTAVLMYVQDYDEHVPRVINNASTEARFAISGLKPLQGDSVFNLMRPYLKNDASWRCPDNKTSFDAQVLNTNGSLNPANASSYQMNFYLTGATVDAMHGKTSGEGLQIEKVVHPETTVLLRDGDSNDGTNIWNNSEIGGATIGMQLYTTHGDRSKANRHFDWGMYVFFDGHAKLVNPEEVSPVKVSDDPTKPCPDCPDKANPKAKVFFNIVK